MSMIKIKSVKASAVKKAYNGKIGCMCGCLGRYWYSTSVDTPEFREEQFLDGGDFSDRHVATIVKKLNDPSTGPLWYVDGCAFKDTGTRRYAVYLCD